MANNQSVSNTVRWGETASSYLTHVHRMTISGADRLISMAHGLQPIDASSYIVDNGAGAGAVSYGVATQYPEARIIATDINRQMLDLIEIPNSTKFQKQVADAKTIASVLPHQEFSHVLCNFVLHTVTEPMHCLEQMKMLLRKSDTDQPGVIGVGIWGKELTHLKIWVEACQSVNPKYQLPQITDDHSNWSTDSELRTALENTGFRNIRTSLIEMPWPFTSAAAYADFWFGVSGSHPIVERCVSSIDEADLEDVRNAVEAIVRNRYADGRSISEPAVLAVATV